MGQETGTTTKSELFLEASGLEMLHFYDFLEMISAYAGWAGRQRLRKQKPFATESEIRRWQDRIRPIVRLYDRLQEPSLRGVPDVRRLFMRAYIEGNALSPSELLRVAEFFEMLAEIKRRCHRYKEVIGPVRSVLARIPSMPQFRKKIKKYIREDGEVRLHHIPETRRLAHRLRKLQNEIEAKLREYIDQRETSISLQEPLITRKEGRFVLMVRSDRKHSIPGLILGVSATGATVFLEPENVVQLNNRYVVLDAKLQKIIWRLLVKLTSLIRKAGNPVQLLNRVAVLDMIFAVARFAREYHCTFPRFTSDEVLRIHGGRNPVLEHELSKKGRKIVPLDLEMGSEHKVLILSGPNAGGKTVVLRTVGLLSLIAQLGFPVPAEEGTLLPVFSHIFSDIGDAQDLRQDLSTFASHVQRWVPMLETRVIKGLYLLDELGSGTDPVEGAALSRAFLEALMQKDGKILAVTQLSDIKMLGFTHPRMLSASMEFVTETLQPSYRLIPNTLGASHALDVARKFGLPPELLDRARSYVDPSQKTLFDVLHKLEQKAQELEDAIAEYERVKQEYQLKHEQAIEKLESLKTRMLHEWQEWQKEVQTWWTKEKARLSELYSALKELENQAEVNKETLRKYMKKVEDEVSGYSISASEIVDRLPVHEIRKGDTIRLRGTQVQGVVEKVNEEKKQVVALFQGKRMTVPLSWVEWIEKKEKPAKSHATELFIPVPQVEKELNVLGMRFEEAREKIERFLSRALIAGLHEVRVIHGYKPGTLKKKILEWLQSHPLIYKIRPAQPHEGGEGASILILKGSEESINEENPLA